jgi:RNA-binding protein
MMTPILKKALKARAHPLKPVVWLGHQGLTPAVLVEINQALASHELIKIKIPGAERDARDLVVAQILTDTLSELVQVMGNIATLYRPKPVIASSVPKSGSRR